MRVKAVLAVMGEPVVECWSEGVLAYTHMHAHTHTHTL